MKITGIKKAVGEFQKLNAGGAFSPSYGILMLDRDDGHVWTDEFYSLGHNSWNEYDSKSIINLGNYMNEREMDFNMKNVKSVSEKLCVEWLDTDKLE